MKSDTRRKTTTKPGSFSCDHVFSRTNGTRWFFSVL